MAIWYILWQFGIFYGNLVYFMAIWYILWQFGIFMAIWYIFSIFGIFFTRFGTYVVARKIWQPCEPQRLPSYVATFADVTKVVKK
jgi:hypothetical protein